MRKIKITDILKKEVASFNKDLFVNTRPTSFQLPQDRLSKLALKISRRHHNYRLYIEKIIDEYYDILNADPMKMNSLITEFDSIVHNSRMDTKINSKKVGFNEKIVSAMRYEDLREKEFPAYLLNSNIRTCVYCNAQSTLTIEPIYYNKKKKKKRKKVLAKLQLDHFHPKSKYPFLCTSYFNLYPTCANCNLAKGKESALFELYTSGHDLDIFKFWIDNKSIINYWINLNLKNLEIKFESLDGNIELLQNHNELFQIQKIYDAQKDIGEELVWKAKANPTTYRKTLNKTFNKIFPDPSIIDRMIISNYSKPEETFKRPMAKYTQDIARQLKII